MCRALKLPVALLVSAAIGAAACGGPSPDRLLQGTLRLALSAEPPTLDWNLATDNVSFDLITNLMEGLTQFNENLLPVPAVAARWEVREGGRRYLFHLRPTASWSDGRPVTADDFVYSWRRLLAPESGAEYAYFLFDVENAREFNAGEVTDPEKVGVRALAPDLLEVRLRRPIAYFPSITTFMVTFPMRRDVIERHGDHWTEPEHLVTNGPFVLREWRHEYRLTLEANGRYDGPPPGVERIEFFVVPQRSTGILLYESGEIDMVELLSIDIPRYESHPDFRRLPMLRGYYYGFNVKKPPFDDVRVRKAFSMAVDRGEFPKILKGGEFPATSWVPPGMLGYRSEVGLGFDPGKARRLLAEAGYPDGQGFPEIEAVFNTDQDNALVAEKLQEQWKRNLNVHVQLRNEEWKVYLKRLDQDPPALHRLGWGADFPDPDNFLNLFTSYSANNHTRWGDPEYDELIERAAKETDLRRRVADYTRAQRILCEEAVPIMPLFVSQQNVLVKPYVRGLQLNAMDLLYLKYVSLEGPGRGGGP